MKFTIDSSLFADSVAAAGSSLSPNPTTPILGGLLVEAQIGAVTLSSFNYDRATIRSASADVADPDIAVVSGRLLSTVAGNLPKKTEATVLVEGSAMVIRAGRTEFRLPLMHSEDYPQLPVMSEDQIVGTVDCEEFSEAAAIIGAFASTDLKTEALANLTSLRIDFDPEWLTLSATDRYIVGRRRIRWDGTEQPSVSVVAADVRAQLKAIAGAKDAELMLNDSMFGVRTPSTTVVTRLLAVEFPDLNRLLGVESYSTTATVSTTALASMLKRVSSIAEDEYSKVDLVVDGDAVAVTTVGESMGGADDAVDADCHGPSRRLCVSSRKLHHTLTAMDDPKVTLGLQSTGYLVAVHPGGYAPDNGELHVPDTDSAALVMGIRSKD